ncbi:MAG: PH domain-containing protein [Thermoproteota archaeon]|nr:PH domain-containing protein [Thermoproteota archaeon]
MDNNQNIFDTDITNEDELNEIRHVQNMLNPNEKVLLVARQSRFLPGGSALTPNIVIATDRRIIIRNPFMLGLKSELVDIPYDVITSVKLQKGVFTSTILFKAPALVNPSKLGLLDENVGGEDDQDGVIEAVPKDKAEDLLEIIRRGMKSTSKTTGLPIQVDSMSVADELAKLSKLKEQGIITDSEFEQMKRQLIEKM